jgi:hypothetical protein
MKKKEEKLSKFDRPPLKILSPPMRNGSMNFMKYPTRIGKSLFYTDGSIGTDKQPATDNDNDSAK